MASFWGFRRSRRQAAARRTFADSVSDHVETFRVSASESGTPAGLTWESVVAADRPMFVVDETQTIIALVLIEVQFGAVEDGEMDDAPGLDMVRAATAVFRLTNRTWMPDPKAIFNFLPGEVVQRQPAWTHITDADSV